MLERKKVTIDDKALENPEYKQANPLFAESFFKKKMQFGDSYTQSTKDQLLASLKLHLQSSLEDVEVPTDSRTVDDFISSLYEDCASKAKVSELQQLIDCTPEEIKSIYKASALITVYKTGVWDKRYSLEPISIECCKILLRAKLLTHENNNFLIDLIYLHKLSNDYVVKICVGFEIIKNAGFEVNDAVRQYVSSTRADPIQNAHNCIPLLSYLKKEKFDKYENVSRAYLWNTNSDVIKILRALIEAKLDHYVDIREACIGLFRRRDVNEIIKTCTKIRNAGFEMNEFLAKAVAEDSFKEDEIIKILSSLKEEKLDAYTDFQEAYFVQKEYSNMKEHLQLFNLLKEAGLAQYVELRKSIFNKWRGREEIEEIISANSILSTIKMDEDLKKDILASTNPIKMAKFFTDNKIISLEKHVRFHFRYAHDLQKTLLKFQMLKEAKLENEEDLLKEMNKSYMSEIDFKNIIEAFTFLKNTKHFKNMHLRQDIISAVYPLEEAIIYDLLSKGKRLEPRLRRGDFWLIRNDIRNGRIDLKNAKEIIESLILLHEAKLDSNQTIIDIVIAKHISPVEDAKAFISLKNANLLDRPGIISAISNSYIVSVTIKRIIEAYSILKEAKLEGYTDIINLVFKCQFSADVAKSILLSQKSIIDSKNRARIIEAIELLEKAELNRDSDHDLRSLVINSSAPEQVARAVISLMRVNSDNISELRAKICASNASADEIIELVVQSYNKAYDKETFRKPSR